MSEADKQEEVGEIMIGRPLTFYCRVPESGLTCDIEGHTKYIMTIEAFRDVECLSL